MILCNPCGFCVSCKSTLVVLHIEGCMVVWFHHCFVGLGEWKLCVVSCFWCCWSRLEVKFIRVLIQKLYDRLCDSWCCSDYSACLHILIVADLGLLEVRVSLNPMFIMIRLVCWSCYCFCRIMFLLGLLLTLCRFILVFMLLLMDPNDVRNGVH